MSKLTDPQLIRQMDPHWTGAIPTFAPPIAGLPKNWVSRLVAENGVEVAWSPGNLAILFGVPVETVQELLEALYAEGEIERGSPDRVGLEAILAVGFRVVSPSGLNFRKWATAALSGFAIKGYLLDKERLSHEGPWDPGYFEFLLEEFDLIRTSALAFPQRIGDLYATAVDYDKDDPCTRALWRKVMSFALDGRTPKPSLAGLPVLDRIMDLYLDFAEDRSRRHLPMTMADWADRFELVLRMKEEDILEGPDEVTGEVARALASGPPQLPQTAPEAFGSLMKRTTKEVPPCDAPKN